MIKKLQYEDLPITHHSRHDDIMLFSYAHAEPKVNIQSIVASAIDGFEFKFGHLPEAMWINQADFLDVEKLFVAQDPVLELLVGVKVFVSLALGHHQFVLR